MARCCASPDARFTPRIGQVLESQFTDIAESQPELLARRCTEAGLIEKAAGLWGRAGERSLSRSALVEAAVLSSPARLPRSPPCRARPTFSHEQIKVPVELTTALMHTEGYASPDTKASLEQARVLIERVEALGEPPEAHCCCSPSSTASGLRTLWRSTVTLYASLRRNSWLSRRSKGRRPHS